MASFKPTFFGPFYLIRQIGKGGTAEVFLGILSSTFDPAQPKKSMFAIKRLLPKLSKHKSFIECLTSEAKVASLLQHPNIVSVSDLGNVGTDYYMSMEWINGKSLYDVLNTVKAKKKAISSHYLIHICYEVSKGLQFAHDYKDSANRRLDIVHCDISPHNIMISYSGKSKLSDFGIATAAKRDEETRDTVFGKIHYISPEQISHKGFDYRADIYSFGVLMYEAITFRKPFRAKSQIELQQKIRTEAPSFDHPGFKEAKRIQPYVEACLEKDPENRPQSLEEFQSIYDKHFAQHEVDQKKISRLMQHLFKPTIIEERDHFRKSLVFFQKALKQKEKEDLARLEQERAHDHVGRVDKTEVKPSSLHDDQTKVLMKEESKGELGKVALQKKKVVRTVPKIPIIEEVSSAPHDPPPLDENIDGEIDENIFDLSAGALVDDDIEANVDLDAIKEQDRKNAQDTTTSENITKVTKVSKSDPFFEDYQKSDARDIIDVPEDGLSNFEQDPLKTVVEEKTPEVEGVDDDMDEEDEADGKSTVPISTLESEAPSQEPDSDEFDALEVSEDEKTQLMEDSIPEYLHDRPDATIEEEEYETTGERDILDTSRSSEVFLQSDQAPVLPIKKEREFTNSLKPITAFQDENTFNLSLQIPKSWVQYGLPIILISLLAFGLVKGFQELDLFAAKVPVENIQVFVSTESNDDTFVFQTAETNVSATWFDQNIVTPSMRFMEKEYAKYNDTPMKLNMEVIQTKSSQPFVIEDPFFKINTAFVHMNELFGLPEKIHQEKDARLFVHVFDMDNEFRPYPFQFSGRSPYHQHIALLVTNQTVEEARVMFVHQALRLMGADILTTSKGHPLYPDGYVEPDKKPLHPQPKGEIMTLMIPQTPTESYLLDNLDFAAIGASTAAQLGWTQSK